MEAEQPLDGQIDPEGVLPERRHWPVIPRSITVSLVLSLHRLFPVIRSPNLTYTFLPDSEVFGLVCSLPLLEDVSLVARTPPRRNQWSSPPTPPQFIGSLAGGSICYPPFVRSPKWSTLQADSGVIVLRRT